MQLRSPVAGKAADVEQPILKGDDVLWLRGKFDHPSRRASHCARQIRHGFQGVEYTGDHVAIRHQAASLLAACVPSSARSQVSSHFHVFARISSSGLRDSRRPSH